MRELMGVQMSNNPNSIVKEGFVQRYKSGFFSNKWKSNFAILYPDSTLALYNDRGDSRPAETILLRNVVPYICVGFMTDRMPIRRPSLPSGTAVQRLVGIGMDPQASKVHWILFPSEQILEEWINAILSTLPKPQNPPQNAPPPSQQPVPTGVGFVPPPKYPQAPPPYGPTNGAPGSQPYPGPYNQPAYGMPAGQYQYPQPQPQTVYIDRPGTGYGRGGGSSGLGTGLAAGMGGALLGSMLGYGLGSMFAPHGGWGGGGWGGGGYGGGYGGGSGFGGGYIQDNDTYITNNYYGSDTDHNTTPVVNADSTGTGDYNTEPVQNDYDYNTEPVQNDYGNDYDGGGGTWDDGGGGGDWGGDSGGGFDGGGGDW